VGLAYDSDNRFAFLIKSLAFSLWAGSTDAGMVFGGITPHFQALSIELPEILMRLIAVGSSLIPIIGCDDLRPWQNRRIRISPRA
jgi:hypothetical protein